MFARWKWLRGALAAGAIGGAAALAAGCGPPMGEVVIDAAPPPEQVEVVGVAPYPGAIWIRGHWLWNGAAHVWMRGHWERGRVGMAWEHGHWVRWGARWRFIPGHWRRI